MSSFKVVNKTDHMSDLNVSNAKISNLDANNSTSGDLTVDGALESSGGVNMVLPTSSGGPNTLWMKDGVVRVGEEPPPPITLTAPIVGNDETGTRIIEGIEVSTEFGPAKIILGAIDVDEPIIESLNIDINGIEFTWNEDNSNKLIASTDITTRGLITNAPQTGVPDGTPDFSVDVVKGSGFLTFNSAGENTVYGLCIVDIVITPVV